MATPRTLSIPPGVDERGGARRTTLDNQGAQAVEQQLILGILGPGRSTNPWLQREASLASLGFQESSQAALDLELRVRSLMAAMEARELARLVSLRIVRAMEGAADGARGQLIAEIRWQPLRLSNDRRPELVTRLGLGS